MSLILRIFWRKKNPKWLNFHIGWLKMWVKTGIKHLFIQASKRCPLTKKRFLHIRWSRHKVLEPGRRSRHKPGTWSRHKILKPRRSQASGRAGTKSSNLGGREWCLHSQEVEAIHSLQSTIPVGRNRSISLVPERAAILGKKSAISSWDRARDYSGGTSGFSRLSRHRKIPRASTTVKESQSIYCLQIIQS